MRSMYVHLALIAALVSVVCGSGLGANNPYGVHTFIQDIMADSYINKNLDWAKSLTGPGGYVKQLMYPITPSTTNINGQWVKFIQGCYDRELIPVIRLGTYMENGVWQKPAADSPGVYTTWANTVKNIVSQMPRNDNIPLYIEVLNECNLNIEWSGQTNPTEYAQCFVQTSNAIRSLGDPRIQVMNCGLSPGGSYNNVQFVEACCQVPGFINAFDVWACHPYPFFPPEKNYHSGTAAIGEYTIDSYMAELQVLANHGRTGVKIIATETGYALGGSEAERADYTMRAFRDYWSKWPEVLGICPYEFCDPFGGNYGLDWVDNSSGTTVDKLPTVAHDQYWAVYRLSKPGHTTGCISGKVTESAFGAPLAGAQVVLSPGSVSTTTDDAGVFMFPRLGPGTYSLAVTRTNYTNGSATNIGLSAEENEARNFSLTATTGCNITGTVRDSIGGQPIQGVKVTLAPGNLITYTDAAGEYRYLGITPSAYTISTSKYSYYSYASPEMTLLAGDSRMHDFYLGPGSPFSANNMIGGGDFEVGSTAGSGWVPEAGSGSHFIVDSSVRYSGISSQRIDVGGSANDMIWQMTNYSSVAPGGRYRIEAWCKTSSPFSGSAKVIGNWFSNDIVHYGSFTGQPVLTTSTGWTLIVARGVCPLPSMGRLHVELRAETTSGSVWFDQVTCAYDNQSEEPVASIYKLTTLPQTASIRFSWYNSSSSNFTGTKVIMRTDRYPTSVTDGTLVYDVPGSPNGVTNYVHSNLQVGQSYYYAFYAHSSGGANLSRPQFATAIPTDLTAPSAPVVNDEGVYTFSTDTLSANWSSSDPESGISLYRYCIGTVAGLADVVSYTDIGTATSVSRGGLTLVPGQTYYFTVRAQNGVGLWSTSGFSNGIRAVRDCPGIQSAKAQPDGTLVRITGVVISGSAFEDCVYVEDTDRTGGIKLTGLTTSPAEGELITVIGTLAMVDGERVLAGTVLQ